MCGIAGFLDNRGSIPDGVYALGQAMADTLEHRGPSGSGIWHSFDSRALLAHRRLSVLDLSEAGSQPMVSSDGRYVLSFNGEIYNHRELRSALDANVRINWKGRSDTETLLEAIAAWGLDEALNRSAGMFALAVFEMESRVLSLAVDRMGEKPLYYYLKDELLIFGSELKALKAHPSFVGEISRETVSLFMKYGYVPSNTSIYESTKKVIPGTLIKVRLGQNGGASGHRSAMHLEGKTYWSLLDVANNTETGKCKLSFPDAKCELGLRIQDTVKSQMIADVPTGVFLSGGIDSSLIASYMCTQSSTRVKTFTIGVGDKRLNEAEHAKRIANFLGTDHTEFNLSAKDALDLIPRLSDIYDEPFADSSQIPTALVSALAARDVVVCLSGDGADEMFGGYNRYVLTDQLWGRLKMVPRPLRHVLAKVLQAVPPATWSLILNPLLSDRFAYIGDKIHKGASVINACNQRVLYDRLISIWGDLEKLLPHGHGILMSELQASFTAIHGCEDMMKQDALNYLPGDILTKVDRSSMAYSLEVRAPFLDHKIVEFAWGLPVNYKIAGGESKVILKALLGEHLPQSLFKRPKMGFGIPLDAWLRYELRDWAENLLDSKVIKDQGFLDHKIVRNIWDEHLSGRRNWQAKLWSVLIFQMWLQGQRGI